MVDQFIRMRFKNSAGNVQTFTALGASTQAIYLDSYEVRDILVTNPKAPEVAVTVGGKAAAVVRNTGSNAAFTVNLDNPQTLDKLRLIDVFVNTNRWIVEFSIMAGYFIWSPGFDGYGLTSASYSMDSILEFDPMAYQKPSFGIAMAATTVQFIARETMIFPLPVASDVIAQAPSGGGN